MLQQLTRHVCTRDKYGRLTIDDSVNKRQVVRQSQPPGPASGFQEWQKFPGGLVTSRGILIRGGNHPALQEAEKRVDTALKFGVESGDS